VFLAVASGNAVLKFQASDNTECELKFDGTKLISSVDIQDPISNMVATYGQHLIQSATCLRPTAST
jgi:hypothetical protein